jgi:hypothetical protein
MPARIAGIQAARMPTETSMRTWVPAVHAGTTQTGGILPEQTDVSSSVFSKSPQRTGRGKIFLRIRSVKPEDPYQPCLAMTFCIRSKS